MKRILPVILTLTILACGGTQTGTKVDEVSIPATMSPSPAPYKVGDVVQVKDYTITLNSVDRHEQAMIANFSIENSGPRELAISSLLSFTAKDSDGSKLEQELINCRPSLDGEVLAGDKLRGNICWVGTAGKVRIYYEDNLFSAGAVVWEVEQ